MAMKKKTPAKKASSKKSPPKKGAAKVVEAKGKKRSKTPAPVGPGKRTIMPQMGSGGMAAGLFGGGYGSGAYGPGGIYGGMY